MLPCLNLFFLRPKPIFEHSNMKTFNAWLQDPRKGRVLLASATSAPGEAQGLTKLVAVPLRAQIFQKSLIEEGVPETMVGILRIYASKERILDAGAERILK